VAAQHQSLLHFIGEGRWSDERVLAKIRELVLPRIERHGPIEAWIIDDTSFPKQGRHSVGVARQYCGQLGKEDNCQVAVSLSLANSHASLPVAYRSYLPQEWTRDRARLRKAGVPAEISFKTKHEIALDQLRWACSAELPRGVVLMDAGYGNNSDFRAQISALGLQYVAGIQSNTTIWPAGTGPLPAKAWSGRGRPPKRLQRMPSTGLSQSRSSRSICPNAPGAQSNGVKVRPSVSPRGLLVCESVSRGAISSAARAGRKNGY
jgi:SRSO17 transposase